MVLDGEVNYVDPRTPEHLRIPKSQLKVVDLPHQAGAAGARMAGIYQGGGQFIAFIDQDDLWVPRKLERQLRTFEADTSADLLHTDVGVVDTRGNILGVESRPRRLAEEKGSLPQETARALFERNYIRLGSVIIRRSSLESVGGFDDTLFGGEDWDFLVRLAASGGVIKHIAEPLTIRRLHGNNTSVAYGEKRFAGKWRAYHRLLESYPPLAQSQHVAYRRLLQRGVKTAILDGEADIASERAWQFVRQEPSRFRSYGYLLLARSGRLGRMLVRGVRGRRLRKLRYRF
jgi:glycosyltransferase involved in cell wall biosynthesis